MVTAVLPFGWPNSSSTMPCERSVFGLTAGRLG